MGRFSEVYQIIKIKNIYNYIMKTLMKFLKESSDWHNDEVKCMMEALTMGGIFTGTNNENRKFVKALYDILDEFENYNSWTSTYYYYTNKTKLTKENEESLKMAETVTPYNKIKFKYKKSENTTGEDMKAAISDTWDGLDVDKEQVYKDNFGTIYYWKSGIYVNSKWGEVCMYPKE